MTTSDESRLPTIKSHRSRRWPDLAGALCLLPIALSAAKAATSFDVIEPTGDLNPQYSRDASPNAQQLIETWRSSNRFMPHKRVDEERFDIRDLRVVLGTIPRAFLQFRILGARGDAITWAGQRCRGRTRAVEIQVFYQWSNFLGAWVPQDTKGERSEDFCADERLWTKNQIERLVHPPALPQPPKVSGADVVTPSVGSPDRVAILNALRPRYENLFGRSISFKVETLRMVSGFAFVVVHPQRPNGAPIERSTWNKALGPDCFQGRLGATHEYWMKKDAGNWRIGAKNDMCADDSIIDQGDLIGAPPQLAEKDAWPERTFTPVPK